MKQLEILGIIGVGGFIGSICRYLLSGAIQSKLFNTIDSGFPFGTLGVNILGCFIIGILYGYTLKNSMTFEWRVFLFTGICGGFTTFSAFSIEMIRMMRDGNMLNAFSYISSSIILGLGATWSGILLMKP